MLLRAGARSPLTELAPSSRSQALPVAIPEDRVVRVPSTRIWPGSFVFDLRSGAPAPFTSSRCSSNNRDPSYMRDLLL